MTPFTRLLLLGFASALVASPRSAAETKPVTYEDDVLPIFRDNCLKCHNPDKLKGDLDLTSFSSAIKGGGSGATLNARDPDGSLLYKAVMHAEEPEMPPKSKISDKEIGVIRQWIEGGLLQGVGSKAIAANKPTMDLALKSVAIGKPEGPPPMPGALPLDPFVRPTHGTPLSAVANSPWAPLVALAGTHQIALYNSNDLEFVGVLPFPEGLPCDVKFSRNGKLLLASGGRGGHSGLVVVWDIAKGERVITVGDQFDSVLAADLSSDQQWIALGGPDRVLKIYNTRDGSLEHRIKKHTEWVTAVEFSPDSKYLATGDRNGGLVLWESASGQEMFSLPGHKGAITAITWRGDSEMFVSASEDGTLKSWKAADGTALRSITAHSGGALAARFTHDGRVVSCGRDNKVQIWDATGKNLLTLPFSGDLPNRVTFSDDGKKVIGSDWKGNVFVWDAKSAKVLGELEANPPTLAERVQRGSQRLAALTKELAQAEAAQAKLDKDLKITQVVLEQTKRSLSEAQAQLSSQESEAKKLAEQSAKEPTSEALKAQLGQSAGEIKTLQNRVATLRKEVASATQAVASAGQKVNAAKTALTDSAEKLATAKASLTKWQSAQQGAKANPAAGKVSMLGAT
jgi:mono/diheme cytochrome c family protein